MYFRKMLQSIMCLKRDVSAGCVFVLGAQGPKPTIKKGSTTHKTKCLDVCCLGEASAYLLFVWFMIIGIVLMGLEHCLYCGFILF